MMGTKRTEKACATRKQLLEAALAVIGEKGYSAATVDEIVDAAGVSKGVAYYHFKSKAVMAESILEEGIDLLQPAVQVIRVHALPHGAPFACDSLRSGSHSRRKAGCVHDGVSGASCTSMPSGAPAAR